MVGPVGAGTPCDPRSLVNAISEHPPWTSHQRAKERGSLGEFMSASVISHSNAGTMGSLVSGMMVGRG